MSLQVTCEIFCACPERREGLPRIGRYRDSRLVKYLFVFICSDDKLKRVKPFLLYPPDFGRPWACSTGRIFNSRHFENMLALITSVMLQREERVFYFFLELYKLCSTSRTLNHNGRTFQEPLHCTIKVLCAFSFDAINKTATIDLK
jgi:hypothetical protein